MRLLVIFFLVLHCNLALSSHTLEGEWTSFIEKNEYSYYQTLIIKNNDLEGEIYLVCLKKICRTSNFDFAVYFSSVELKYNEKPIPEISFSGKASADEIQYTKILNEISENALTKVNALKRVTLISRKSNKNPNLVGFNLYSGSTRKDFIKSNLFPKLPVKNFFANLKQNTNNRFPASTTKKR